MFLLLTCCYFTTEGVDLCKYLMKPWFLCTDRAYGPGIVIKSWQQEEHDFLSSKRYNIFSKAGAWFSMFQTPVLLQHPDDRRRMIFYNIVTKEGAHFSIVQTHTMLQLCLHHENRKSMVLYSLNRDHAPPAVMKS